MLVSTNNGGLHVNLKLEIYLNRAVFFLAPYFFDWFVIATIFYQTEENVTPKYALSSICWAIGILWFYMQIIGLFHFLKLKVQKMIKGV